MTARHSTADLRARSRGLSSRSRALSSRSRRQTTLILACAVAASVSLFALPAGAAPPAGAPTMPAEGVIDVVVTRASGSSWPNHVSIGDDTRLCENSQSQCSTRTGWFAAGTVLTLFAKEGDSRQDLGKLSRAERQDLGQGHWLYKRTLSSGNVYTVEVTVVGQAAPAPDPTVPAPTSPAPTAPQSPPSTPPDPDTYVALGDSYASGEGAPNHTYDEGTSFPDKEVPRGETGCHRSSRSWAYDVSVSAVDKKRIDPRGLAPAHAMRLVACSGAELEDLYHENKDYEEYGEVEPAQLDVVEQTTPKLVTLSIGGNDGGFAKIVKDCVNHVSHNGFGCRKRDVDKGAAAIADEELVNLEQGKIPFKNNGGGEHSLAQAYVDIAEKMAGGGLLVVTGYPKLFAESKLLYTRFRSPFSVGRFDCRVGTGEALISAYVSYDDAKWLNGLAARVNTAISKAVDDATTTLREKNVDVQVRYAPVSRKFTDHRLCSGDRWLNGAVIPFNPKGLPAPAKQSFHPNEDGQRAYARAVSDVL